MERTRTSDNDIEVLDNQPTDHTRQEAEQENKVKKSFGHRTFKIETEREMKAKGTIVLLKFTLILNIVLSLGFLIVYF